MNMCDVSQPKYHQNWVFYQEQDTYLQHNSQINSSQGNDQNKSSSIDQLHWRNCRIVLYNSKERSGEEIITLLYMTVMKIIGERDLHDTGEML